MGQLENSEKFWDSSLILNHFDKSSRIIGLGLPIILFATACWLFSSGWILGLVLAFVQTVTFIHNVRIHGAILSYAKSLERKIKMLEAKGLG